MARTVKSEYDVFISHAHSDAAYVDELVVALEQAGVRVWHDRGALRLSEDFSSALEQALEESPYFVLVISPDYLASQWCNFEMGVVLGRKLTQEAGRVIPLYLRPVDPAKLPASINQLQWLSARQLSVKQVARILAEVIKQPEQLKQAS